MHIDNYKCMALHVLYVMAQEHPTVEPEQTTTDTFAVFGDQSAQLDMSTDLVLIARVEVPRYSTPTADGVELTPSKRYQMAVQWAVTKEATSPDPAMVEGEEFMVMYDMDEPMAFAEFEKNPAVAGCWNPNEETAADFAGDSDE